MRRSPGREVRAFLFADAEVREDVAEDVVGMDRSSNLAEMVQRLARINGNQVARNSVAQTITDGLECGFGGAERLEMTKIGDNELVALVVGAMTF